MLRFQLQLLALTAGASLAHGQTLSIVVTEGDSIPGVGNVTRVDGVQVNDYGVTLIEVDTDNPDTAADSVMLRDGALYLRENESLPSPPGSMLGGFDGTSLNRFDLPLFNFFLDGTAGTNDNSGIYVGNNLVLQEGDISNAPGFTAGTPYIGFFDVEWANGTRFLIVASIDDPNIASTVDRALVLYDYFGSTETVLVKEGDILSGQTEAVADFETGAEESAINTSGSVIYTANLAGDTSVDYAIYLDQTLLMQEGSPSPVAGRNWGSLTSAEVDLNDYGDWVVKANLDSTDTSTDQVIVRNGSIFMREGDTLPDIAPFTFEDFGSSVGVWITNTGDVLWFGDWDDPDTSRDEGLFLNDQLILQEGVTQIGGQTIIDLSDITEQVAVSPEGNYALVEGEIAGPSQDLDVVIRIAFDLGEKYCGNFDNSTELPTIMSLAGSGAVADNDLTLQARNVPLTTFGFFITSQTPGVSTSPIAQGFLCLSGQIGRYVGPGQIQNSGGTGTYSLALDLTMTPQPMGFVSVAPGETWYFQCWHRDTTQTGGATSIFSDAVSLTFQ